MLCGESELPSINYSRLTDPLWIWTQMGVRRWSGGAIFGATIEVLAESEDPVARAKRALIHCRLGCSPPRGRARTPSSGEVFYAVARPPFVAVLARRRASFWAARAIAAARVPLL